jgi:hypothetical protein
MAGIEQLVGGDRQLGVRFQLVSMVPSTAAVLVVLGVVWSGAPAQPPRLSRAVEVATGLDAGEAVLLVFAITVVALVLQPLQRLLVRTLEGYWLEQPWWPLWLRRLGTAWPRWRLRRLGTRADQDPTQTAGGRGSWRVEAEQQRAGTAAYQRWRRYPAEERLLPSALGNALRAAEDDAGQRYGLETVLAWPALYVVLGDRARAIVDDQRLQLDVAARLAASLTVTALVVAGLLWRWWPWRLLMPAGLLVLGWVSYRAAVSAAIAYGDGLRLAFDLSRFDLLAALHLPLPADADSELAANRRLSAFLALGKPLQATYQHADESPAAPSPPPPAATGPAAPAAADPEQDVAGS